MTIENDPKLIADLDNALLEGDYERARKLLSHLSPIGGWGEHPRFPFDAWRYEAGRGDTRVSYVEWLTHRLEFED